MGGRIKKKSLPVEMNKKDVRQIGLWEMQFQSVETLALTTKAE